MKGRCGKLTLVGSQAVDWEDIAIGPGPVSGQDYLYVGDIGDNNRGSNVAPIYRVPEPSVSLTQTPAVYDLSGVDAIVLRYPQDSAHNAETLMVDPDNGDIWIVTKHPQGASTVFHDPAPHATSGTVPLTEVTTLGFPGSGGVEEATGGDISADGSQIVVRTYAIAYIWRRMPGTTIADAWSNPVCVVSLRPEPQGESITFSADGRGLYTLSEGPAQPIWFFARTN